VLERLTSRRAFLRNTAMATAAGVAGYVVGRTSGLTKPKRPGTEPNGYGPPSGGGKYLAALSAVPAHGGGLILASDHVVLVREADGQVKGFSSTCTHQGCTVALVVKGIIQCPCHGSQFSAANGAVIQGPATRPLPPVPVSVRNGYVYP
jgi:Rieske Fe-S protein